MFSISTVERIDLSVLPWTVDRGPWTSLTPLSIYPFHPD